MDMKVFDMSRFVAELAVEIRKMAKDAGTSCDMPNCDALTLGTRCQGCMRRTCGSHSWWLLSMKRPVAYCTYCVVQRNRDLFQNVATPDSGNKSTRSTGEKKHSRSAAADGEDGEEDVIDAEYEDEG